MRPVLPPGILAAVEDDTNPTRQRGRTLHGAPSRIKSMERSPSLARRVSVGIFKCVVLGREENNVEHAARVPHNPTTREAACRHKEKNATAQQAACATVPGRLFD